MKPYQILERADQLICGDRMSDYGDPRENFSRIAGLWSAYLGYTVTPPQVATCMALLKISRVAHQPRHEDSAIDACGYVALAHGLADAFDRCEEGGQ